MQYENHAVVPSEGFVRRLPSAPHSRGNVFATYSAGHSPADATTPAGGEGGTQFTSACSPHVAACFVFRSTQGKRASVLPALKKSRLNSLLLLFLCLFSAVGSSCFADAGKLYGEYTLEEWRQIVKTTDFRTLGAQRYVNGLSEIIIDESAPWASRKQAGETLGRIGENASSAIPLLQELLLRPGEDAVSTRLWVLKSLSLFATLAAEVSADVSHLILDSSQPHLVRLNAMETLGRIGELGEIALPTFVEILNRPQGEKEPAHDELRVGAADALWLLGPLAAPALPALIDAAREDWSPMRIAAITTIGQIGPQSEIAIPMLVDVILFDEAGEVREAAADALGKIGSPAWPALRQLQQDPEEDVRQYVMRAVVQMGDSPVVRQLLLNGLKDESSLVRIEAANELLKRDLDEDLAEHLLLEHLGSEHRRSRLTAYQAIYVHLLDSKSLQTALRERAQDPSANDLERSNAIKLLRKLNFDRVVPGDEPSAGDAAGKNDDR